MSEPGAASADLQVPEPVWTMALAPDRSGVLEVASLARWRRRRLIRRIERQTGGALLCYVSQGPPIGAEDVLSLQELLNGVPAGTPVALLLESLGGNVDVAEKLVRMLRRKAQGATAPAGGDALRIIVPDRAKSAATLMTFGADRVVMSDTSELGPIDPQFLVERDGRTESYSVWAYLGARRLAEQRCREEPDNGVFRAAFEKFDPLLAYRMQRELERVGQAVEDLLRANGSNYTLARRRFVLDNWMNPKVLPTHEQSINFARAREFGLAHVEYMKPTSPLWKMYWDLYLALRRVCGDDRKVFESRTHSRVTVR